MRLTARLSVFRPFAQQPSHGPGFVKQHDVCRPSGQLRHQGYEFSIALHSKPNDSIVADLFDAFKACAFDAGAQQLAERRWGPRVMGFL